MHRYRYLLLLFPVIILILSCKKESFITTPDARLTISADSIKFDTVFTTTGSVTRSFKIFNENEQRILLSSVKLEGGVSSPFKININGAPVAQMNNIEIAAEDSIYVFVSVNIDPTVDDLPFILSDSISISYNGVVRYVHLQAYGQNANFLQSTVISGNVSWVNTKPYVILGGIQIDTNATLNIDPGTKIYLHANAPFIIDGTVIANGTNAQKIIFTSDRLDEEYRDLPASWPGIYIRNVSNNNQFTFVTIKNAYQGIVVEGMPGGTNPKLKLSKSIIDNAYDAGLYCIGTYVTADNSLISNCGKNILIEAGGNYDFTHCTVASYSNQFIFHDESVLTVSNFITVNGVNLVSDLTAMFRNCLFWGDFGNTQNEVEVFKQGNTIFDVTMDHCLYKASNDPANTNLLSVIRNADPLFDSINVNHRYYDFRTSINPDAPGVDNGTATPLSSDLDDNIRPVGLPDIGAFEKQ